MPRLLDAPTSRNQRLQDHPSDRTTRPPANALQTPESSRRTQTSPDTAQTRCTGAEHGPEKGRETAWPLRVTWGPKREEAGKPPTASDRKPRDGPSSQDYAPRAVGSRSRAHGRRGGRARRSCRCSGSSGSSSISCALEDGAGRPSAERYRTAGPASVRLGLSHTAVIGSGAFACGARSSRCMAATRPRCRTAGGTTLRILSRCVLSSAGVSCSMTLRMIRSKS
jgi:hypothetical protein